MFGSVILEVAIGIIFVYLLISIVCTSVREGIEAMLKTRAAYLERGIRELLHDRNAQNIARSLFEHPMINSLYSSDYTPGKNTNAPRIFDSGKNLPSYIPSKNFALALMDIAARGAKSNAASSDPNSAQISLESIRSNVLNIQNVFVQRALLTALDSAQGDLARLQQNLENWFDSSMDRVSGWYKRSTQWILFMIGLIVSIGLNVNTIRIADFLYHNEDARKLIIAQAETASKDSTFIQKNFEDAQADLAAIKLPIGWEDGKEDQFFLSWNGWGVSILGWLLTAIAATLGAPFWFDLLNKIMVIRATVKPAEKSGEEGSEDRQNNKQSPVIVQMMGERQVQPQPAVATPAIPADAVVLDEESDIDHCLAVVDTPTADEDLPPAEGGIA